MTVFLSVFTCHFYDHQQVAACPKQVVSGNVTLDPATHVFKNKERNRFICGKQTTIDIWCEERGKNRKS